jgi:hypothetical protein
MPVRTFSISLDERTHRQLRAAAENAGTSVSAWIARAAREKIQRDAAAVVAEADRLARHDWADWTEANERDFAPPGRGRGAA